MSGRIVGEVGEHAPDDLTPSERLVLVFIAEDARERDRRAQYSDLETLVRKTRLKPGTVRNALSELVRRGILTPQLQRVSRGGKHQEYVVAKLDEHHRRAVVRPINGHTG